MFDDESFVIKQDKFDPENNRYWESIMSTGNGELGGRGNHEEAYSGDSLDGRYISGVYYNDKTRVGWWKNGYPEYFAKIVNVPNFFGLDVKINGAELDLAKVSFENYLRTLNMKNGVLTRSFIYVDENKNKYKIKSERFYSYNDPETAVLKYSVTALDSSADLNLTPYINADVKNENANYDEKFFNLLSSYADENKASVNVKTRKTDFLITSAFTYELSKKEEKKTFAKKNSGSRVEIALASKINKGETVSLTKYISIYTSLNHKEEDLGPICRGHAEKAKKSGYDVLFCENAKTWSEIWRTGDISIEGDLEAQKAIRYNIFQLNCSYSGAKSHLNIGPKGFTGEKYGGGVYWDIEAFCIYFFLSTKKPEVARTILLYRYNQLGKAKENAAKLGLSGALYPMVTVNGEECHNEWEITFEELHRNSAIAYAIKNYIDYTGDKEYLSKYGIDVLVEICRFWASRVNIGNNGMYMILGVTGPNEYENNVNNNWYTNRMAKWCFQYTVLSLKKIYDSREGYDKIKERLHLTNAEVSKWGEIAEDMYLPYDSKNNIFLQQDGFLDKDIVPADKLPESERPLNKFWSWDRILRSCYIKQADVLQGLWFLDDCYDIETKKRNFDFYEPLTVHESSLSPSVHSILASELGRVGKAYEMFLRTSMLDLHNVNKDTADGLHITSMAGTWMCITYGFGGVRIKNGEVILNPVLPKEWKGYAFQLYFRGTVLKISVEPHKCRVEAQSGNEVTIIHNSENFKVSTQKDLEFTF